MQTATPMNGQHPALTRLLENAAMTEAIEQSLETAAGQPSLALEVDRLKTEAEENRETVAALTAELTSLTQTVSQVRRDLIRVKHRDVGPEMAGIARCGDEKTLSAGWRYGSVAILLIILLLLSYL